MMGLNDKYYNFCIQVSVCIGLFAICSGCLNLDLDSGLRHLGVLCPN